MDTMSAMMMCQAHGHNELMVFDWDRAATLINEQGAKEASAGLAGDWEWTGGEILEDGEIPADHYTYLASTWAKPELKIGGITIECYKMQSETDHWDANTFWPESAREILEAEL